MRILSSIILCTRNRPQDVIKFLDSVAKQKIPPEELIIVDSSDIPLDKNENFGKNFPEKLFGKIKLIYKHTTPGLTKQRNIGIHLASSEVLHFLDDDVILDETYLQEMNKIFVINPNYAGGMGSVQNLPLKRKTFSRFFRTFFLLQRIRSSGKFTWSGMPTHTYGTNKFKNVEVLGGCCMAYRKKIFENYRFDESLKGYAYMEDCDLSARVSHDHPLFFNPKAKLKHMVSPVSRDSIVENRAMFIKNYSYFFFKNFYPRNKLKILAYFWSITGLFLEALLYRNFKHLKGYARGLKRFYF